MIAETYRQIIAACFPDLRIESCQCVSQGWDSIVVSVNGELIFRFPKRADVEPQYRKEALLLPALAGHVALPIPRFAYVWEGGEPYDHPFVGYPMIAGAQLTCELLGSLDQDRLAAQLARFIAELHGFPLGQAALALAPDDGEVSAAEWATRWRDGYRTLYADIQSRVFPLLEATAQGRVAACWEAFLADEVTFQFRPGLVHNDLNEEHILVDPERSQVTGIIDWSDAAIGDPAIDFTGLLADYGAEFARLTLSYYAGPIDPTFWDRAEFYRFVMPFHEVRFGLYTGLRQHVEQGLAGIAVAIRQSASAVSMESNGAH